MRRWLALLFACAVGLSSATTAWSKSYRLSPSSEWALEPGLDSCQVWRKFGTGEDKVFAQFFRYEPSVLFDLTLIGKPLGEPKNRPKVRLQFGPGGQAVQSFGMGGVGGALPVVFLSGRLDNLNPNELGLAGLSKLPVEGLRQLDTIDPGVETAVTEVTVQIGNRAVTLELGSMGPPMAAMRKCTAELVKAWGLDPAEQENLQVPAMPKTDPGTWLLPSDYPEWSAMWGHQAIVRFRLMIDATGKVTNCAVQSALARGPFAAMTCELLTLRANFEPARAAGGQPVASYYASKAVWILD